MVGGVLVAAAVAVPRFTPKIMGILDETHQTVNRTAPPALTLRDAGSIKESMAPLIMRSAWPLLVHNIVTRARHGDKDALKSLVNYVADELQMRAVHLPDGDKEEVERVFNDICSELGITHEEYRTLEVAHGINEHLKIIRDNGIEDLLTRFKFSQILRLLCEDAERYGPYNRLLMRALGMNHGAFHELVEEVYQFSIQDRDKASAYHSQLVVYLEYTYNL